MNERIALAVIGCGDVATSRHLPAIVANADVQLVAVCDTDGMRAEQTMASFGAERCSTDATDILHDGTVDAVIVATPPWVTPKLTIAALAAGKDVLCEKPMAMSLDEARAVLDAEQRTDRFVQVGFVLRHGPMFESLRRWIADGLLGGPLDVRISVFDETWDPKGNPAHYQRILATLEHGAPCIHDGAHTMDHLHYLLDDRVVRLTSWGRKTRAEFPRPNLNLAVMEFETGHRARVEIGWFLPVFPEGEWSIIGTTGIASFNQGAGQVTLESEAGTEVVALPPGEDWFTSCFRHQLERFVGSIRTRNPPRPGSADGVASLALSQNFEKGMAHPFAAHEVSYP